MPRAPRGTTRRSTLRSSAQTSVRASLPAQNEALGSFDHLQQTVGNRTSLRLLSRNVLQRQPNPAADRREFVRDTINFFNNSTQYYSNPRVPVTREIFDRVLNGSYAAVVKQEEIIDKDLAGDADLKRELRAAYIGALRVMMRRAAAVLRKSEADLYRENSGRIPMWAYQIPHHLEPGISTPIREGLTVNRAGNVTFKVNGFDVTIAPDITDPTLVHAAKTRHNIGYRQPVYRVSPAGVVTDFTPPPTPTMLIQTTFRPGVTAASQSAYGRGTTPEDIAGGAITPRTRTLGFHEGTHGLDVIEFLEQHAPPQFRGTKRMTRGDFEAEIRTWEQAWKAYSRSLTTFAVRRGDCVGTTIDQFNQAQAPQGTQIVLECGP
ncbi:MAG TPA: hypothetical protein VFP64_20775 [Pyrinomonadaceae bacterium]|nr:hypothetical protein [Pyrinomonadaceae bacterium]